MTPSRRQQRDLSELDAALSADHTLAAVLSLFAQPPTADPVQRTANPWWAWVARLMRDIVSHVRTRADVVRCSIATALVSMILRPARANKQQPPTERL